MRSLAQQLAEQRATTTQQLGELRGLCTQQQQQMATQQQHIAAQQQQITAQQHQIAMLLELSGQQVPAGQADGLLAQPQHQL
jgi:hypothetical protein